MKILSYILLINLGFLTVLPIVQLSDTMKEINCYGNVSNNKIFIKSKLVNHDNESCSQSCCVIQNQSESNSSTYFSEQNTKKETNKQVSLCNPLENCNCQCCVIICYQKYSLFIQMNKSFITYFAELNPNLSPKFSFWQPPKYS